MLIEIEGHGKLTTIILLVEETAPTARVDCLKAFLSILSEPHKKCVHKKLARAIEVGKLKSRKRCLLC